MITVKTIKDEKRKQLIIKVKSVKAWEAIVAIMGIGGLVAWLIVSKLL